MNEKIDYRKQCEGLRKRRKRLISEPDLTHVFGSNPETFGVEHLESDLASKFAKVNSSPQFWFEIQPVLAVENLLSEAETLLRNCLNIREQCFDLETRAFATAWEIHLGKQQHIDFNELVVGKIRPLLDQIIKRDLNSASGLAEGIEKAAQIIDSLSGAEYAAAKKVFETISEYLAKSSDIDSSQSIGLLKSYVYETIDRQLGQLREYTKDLHSVFTDEKHGMSFGSRFLKLKKIFTEDMTDAYIRMLAAEVGLKTLFGMSFGRASTLISEQIMEVESHKLDKMVDLLRDATRLYEEYTWKDVTTVVTIPLRYNQHKKPVAESQYITTFASKNRRTGTFYIDESFFSSIGLSNPRLQSIGVSVLQGDQGVTINQHLVGLYNAELRLPDQTVKVDDSTQSYLVPNVSIGQVVFAGQGSLGKMHGELSFINSSPVGEYELKIHGGIRPFDHIQNIVVSLEVRGKSKNRTMKTR